MTLRHLSLSAFTAAVMLAAAAPTGAQANIVVGGLSCVSPGTVGAVVGAVLNFNCVFMPSDGSRPQRYAAVVRRVGLDLGYTQNVGLGWTVFAATAVIHQGDLAGSYAGVQAGASFGVGLGANALVGGSNNSFVLQPVSAQAQGGLNVAAGLAGLELQPVADIRAAPVHIHHRRHHKK